MKSKENYIKYFTDNVDEFDNMLEYNKNSQKQRQELTAQIFKMSQQKDKK